MRTNLKRARTAAICVVLLLIALLFVSGCRAKKSAIADRKDIEIETADSARKHASRRDSFILSRIEGRKADIIVKIVELSAPDTAGRQWPERLIEANIKTEASSDLSAVAGSTKNRESVTGKKERSRDKSETVVKKETRPGRGGWWLLVGGVIAALVAYRVMKAK